jgi:hypothetical protein
MLSRRSLIVLAWENSHYRSRLYGKLSLLSYYVSILCKIFRRVILYFFSHITSLCLFYISLTKFSSHYLAERAWESQRCCSKSSRSFVHRNHESTFYTIVESQQQCHSARAFIFVLTSYFASCPKNGWAKRPWTKLGHSSVARFCNMNERMARKRLFLETAGWRSTVGIKISKWRSRDGSRYSGQGNELVVCCLTLRTRSISRRTLCVIVAISAISNVKVCGKIVFSKNSKNMKEILVTFQW